MSWQKLQLGQMCSLRAGMVFKPNEQGAISGDLPFIKVSDMNLPENAIAIRGANNWVLQEFVERTRAKPFPIGTTVFAKIGEALRQNRVRHLVRPTLIDNNMMGAIPKADVVTPEFLYYRLSAFDIAATATGTALPYLTVSVLEQQKFEVPSLDVQRRIASILSAYDDLIENNTRRIAILEEMARRIYEEWFVRFRFPGHENVRMVETELGLVPMEWSSATLGSICAYINRGIAPKYDDGAPGIVINQKCIRDQRLSLSAARRQSKAIPKEKLIVPGDVLINSTGVGTLGRVAQVLEPVGSCTVDTHVTIVRPSSSIDKDFFGIAMFHKQPHFEAQGVGSTGQTELSRSRIADAGILLPPQALQAQFGNLVSPMRQLAVRLQCKNANLSTTRDLLLPKLISGELDVSDLPEPGAAAA